VFTTLGKSNIYEWFTNIKELKSNYSHATEMGFAIQCKKISYLSLKKYLELRDALVSILQKMRVVR
jgi:hypothetical protein